MSKNGPEFAGDKIAKAIESAFGRIDDLNIQIEAIKKKARPLEEQRDEILATIRQKIREEGVPEEEKLTAYLLMNCDMSEPPEQMWAEVDALNKIDEKIKEASGQAISWLSVEEETVSHRFPGPDKTKNSYHLNVGLLPYNASLKISYFGAQIPVEKAFRVEIFNNLDVELSWNLGLGDFYHFVGHSEQLHHPELYVSSSGPIGFAKGSKEIKLPPPLIGNKEVEAVFTEHQLEEEQQVAEALNSLTDSLFDK